MSLTENRCGRDDLWIGSRRRCLEGHKDCHQWWLNEWGYMVCMEYEVRCGQEKVCLTVRGVSVPQRLHDRSKRCERVRPGETDFMASLRLVR